MRLRTLSEEGRNARPARRRSAPRSRYVLFPSSHLILTHQRTSEMDEMRRRWAREDEERALQKAADADYEREKKWARQDARKEQTRRVRPDWLAILSVLSHR